MGNQEYWVGNLEHPRTLKPEPHPSTLSPTGLGSGSIWSIAACCCHWFFRFNKGIQSYSPPWRWGMTFWQALHMTSEHGTLPSGFLDFTIPRQPAQNGAFRCEHIPLVPVRCGNNCTIQPTSVSTVSIDKWGFLLNPLRSRPFPLLQHTSTGSPGTKLPPGHSGEWQGDHRGHPVQSESAQPKFSHLWGASCWLTSQHINVYNITIYNSFTVQLIANLSWNPTLHYLALAFAQWPRRPPSLPLRPPKVHRNRPMPFHAPAAGEKLRQNMGRVD